ncbi:hypothetical protein [Oceanivirga salmonicida]|uniref:hypothetical protein n=1 Tax=Oceanivirga salmonicida TaxID=1769291 RepID=UPI0012E1D24F|nr:hypothetical protein [Oceanivirga salmonicida]
MKKFLLTIIAIFTLPGLVFAGKPDNINVIGNVGVKTMLLRKVYGVALGVNVQPEWIFKGKSANIGIGPVFGLDTSLNWGKSKEYFLTTAQINLGVRYDIYLRNNVYIGSEFGIPIGIQIGKKVHKVINFNPEIINVKLIQVGKKFGSGFRVGGYIGFGSKGIIGLELGQSF